MLTLVKNHSYETKESRNTMLEIIIAVLGGLGLGGILGWWLTERLGLEIAHKHRVIEEHTKRVHEYSEKYYVKVISNVEFVEKCLHDILQQLNKSKSPSQESLELSFFGFARLSKLEEEWLKDISGTLMLADRTAERLIACLHGQVEELLINKIGCIDREADGILRDKIQSLERFSDFKVKIQKQQLKPIADKFRSSIQSDTTLLSTLISTLHCLHRLFYFEMNTCFDAWYRKGTMKPCFEKSDWETMTNILDKLIQEGKVNQEDKDRYLKRIGFNSRATGRS